MGIIELRKIAGGSVVGTSIAVLSCLVLGSTGYHIYGMIAGISSITIGILSLSLALKVRTITPSSRSTMYVMAKTR